MPCFLNELKLLIDQRERKAHLEIPEGLFSAAGAAPVGGRRWASYAISTSISMWSDFPYISEVRKNLAEGASFERRRAGKTEGLRVLQARPDACSFRLSGRFPNKMVMSSKTSRSRLDRPTLVYSGRVGEKTAPPGKSHSITDKNLFQLIVRLSVGRPASSLVCLPASRPAGQAVC